jgi:hypothetical protein
MIDSIVDQWHRGCAGSVSPCLRGQTKMASSAGPKTSSEPILRNRFTDTRGAGSQLRQNYRYVSSGDKRRRPRRSVTGAEVRGWTAFRGS